jgi:hypothetical protein
MGADTGADPTLALIGTPDPKDTDIKPLDHGALYRTTAPELARVLESNMAVVGYADIDRGAMTARDNYKGRLGKAIWLAIGAAACAATAAVYSGVIKDTQLLPLQFDLLILRILVSMQIGVLLCAAILAGRATGAYKDWRETRARAEFFRTELFLAAMQTASEKTPADPKAVDQALAYVRRFLWHSQLMYFTERGAKHLAEVEKRVRLRRVLTIVTWVSMGAIAVVAVMSFMALTPLGDMPVLGLFRGEVGVEAVVGGGGVLIAAILSAGETREAIDGDRENARRYEQAAKMLRLHGGDAWDGPSASYVSAALKAKAGEPKEARQWTQTVVDILRREYEEWRMAEQSDIRLEPMADLIRSHPAAM